MLDRLTNLHDNPNKQLRLHDIKAFSSTQILSKLVIGIASRERLLEHGNRIR